MKSKAKRNYILIRPKILSKECTQVVDAWVIGSLALHHPYMETDSRKWVLTHIPSGYTVSGAFTYSFVNHKKTTKKVWLKLMEKMDNLNYEWLDWTQEFPFPENKRSEFKEILHSLRGEYSVEKDEWDIHNVV